MAHDMAVDLRPHGVAVVSLWMGLLDTERTAWAMSDPETARKYASLRDRMESPQFTGRVIDALARDPRLPERSGRVWIGAELAREYFAAGAWAIGAGSELIGKDWFSDSGLESLRERTAAFVAAGRRNA